jgi:hypothetical protein
MTIDWVDGENSTNNGCVDQRERKLMMGQQPNRTGVSRANKAFYVESGTMFGVRRNGTMKV